MNTGVKWTQRQVDKLIRLKRSGVSSREISRQLGKSNGAINNKWQMIRGTAEFGDLIPEPLPADPVPVPGQSVQEELKQFERSAAPVVSCNWQDDEEDIEKVWLREEANNAKHIEKARARNVFTVDFPGNDPVAISFASDEHIAPGTPVDLARMRADAEYVRDTPNLYCCEAGDGVDNHIKHRAAILAARSQPSDQYRLFEHYLSIKAEKIIALCSGNHDAWSVHFAGVDILQMLAQRHQLCYAPDEARLDVKLGDQTYRLDFRHQYRMNSSFNQTHAVKQWLRLGEREFDVGIIGHHHEAACESFVYRGKEHWGARPGSYQVLSAHSRQYGYNSSYPTCPAFILYPDRRKITGMSDMRDAGLFLKALLGTQPKKPPKKPVKKAGRK